MKAFVAKVLFVIGRERRPRWLLLLGCALAVSIAEALAAASIALLLTMLAEPEQPLRVPLLGTLDVSGTGAAAAFAIVGALLVTFFVIRGGLILFQAYVQNRVAHNTGADLSTRLLDGYLHMPYAVHLRRNAAELMRNAYTTAAEIVVYVLVPIVQGVSEGLVMIALAVVVVAAAPLPSIVAAIVLGCSVYTVQRAIRPRLGAYGDESTRILSSILQSVQDAIAGVREVQIYDAHGHVVEHFAKQRRILARANYMRSVLVEVPRTTVETAVVAFVVLLLITTISGGRSPREALTVVSLFAYAAFRALPSINRVVAAVNNCRFGAASLAAVYKDLRIVERFRRNNDEGLVVVQGPVDELVLRDIEVRYDVASEAALMRATLQLRGGEAIGIVGATGSGKSTLVHVVAGLLEPERGSFVLNGKTLPGVKWRWDGQVGFVAQEVLVMSDTIRRNIAFGVEDDAIDHDRVREAVEVAQLHDVVRRLPEGLDTIVGVGGVRLSGGERQRISIARAIYHQPEILILDEGTSALDVVTERNLLRALAAAQRPRTVLHVAHRLTSLQHCDRIVIVESGRIVDEGSYYDVARRNPSFRTAAGDA